MGLMRIFEIIAVLWIVQFLWKEYVRSQANGGGPRVRVRGRRYAPPPSSARPAAPQELKRDPQCGTYVSPELSHRCVYRGQEIDFCSAGCAQAFLKAHSAHQT